MKIIKVGNKILGQKKVFVIAEIGLNHNGKTRDCKKLINAAKKAGADAVKLQISDPYESYFKGTNSFNTFLKYSLTEKQLKIITDYAKLKKILAILE